VAKDDAVVPQHTLEVISATRVLLYVLRSICTKTGRRASKQMAFVEAKREIDKVRTVLKVSLASDPSTKRRVPSNKICDVLEEYYQSIHRPDIGTKLLRLRQAYRTLLLCRVLREFRRKRLPKFTVGELNEVTLATDELEICALRQSPLNPDDGNRILPEKAIEIVECAVEFLNRLSTKPVDVADALILTIETARAAWRLERLANPNRHPFRDKRRGLWGKPPRISLAIGRLCHGLCEAYEALEWQGVCTAKSDPIGPALEVIVGKPWYQGPYWPDLPQIDFGLMERLRGSIIDVCVVSQQEFDDAYKAEFQRIAPQLPFYTTQFERNLIALKPGELSAPPPRQQIDSAREPSTGEFENKPIWISDRGQLMFRGNAVKTIKYRTQAKNQIAILVAFQELNWPERIDDPLTNGPNSLRLNDSVKSLNRNLSEITFHCDGSGKGIRWTQG
jgi:hypothetical protein